MRLFNFLAGQPWAITADYAQRMVEIYELALERKAKGEELDKQALEKQLGRPLDNTRTVTVRDGVATIPVEGPLFRRADMFTEISGATTVESLAKDFNAALDDPAVKSIVLYIDSPGGEVNGTNEFSDMIFAARGSKPVIAYVAHAGASAAYWIASAADEVVVDATAAVGSIGVIAAVRDPTKEKSKDIRFVSSQSPNKNPDPTTTSGKSQIQAHVDDLAQVFVDTIARNRNVSSETVVKDFGGGGLLVGQKAVDAGLADRVGSYESVLSELQSGERISSKSKTHAADNGAKTMSENQSSTLWQRFVAGLKGDEAKAMLAENEGRIPSAPTIPSSPPPPAASEESDEIKKLRTKAAQVEKYETAIKAARETEAETFAGSLVVAKVLMPAAKDKVKALYIQHAQDDEASPLPTGSVSRVEAFKAMFEGLPKHNLTTEQMAADLPAGAVVLNPDPGTDSDKMIAETRAGAAAWQKNQNPSLHKV